MVIEYPVIRNPLCIRHPRAVELVAASRLALGAGPDFQPTLGSLSGSLRPRYVDERLSAKGGHCASEFAAGSCRQCR